MPFRLAASVGTSGLDLGLGRLRFIKMSTTTLLGAPVPCVLPVGTMVGRLTRLLPDRHRPTLGTPLSFAFVGRGGGRTGGLNRPELPPKLVRYDIVGIAFGGHQSAPPERSKFWSKDENLHEHVQSCVT